MIENGGWLGRIRTKVSRIARDFLAEARRSSVEGQFQDGFVSLGREARRRQAEFGHLLDKDLILFDLRQQHGATPEEIGALNEAIIRRRAEILWADDPPSVVQAAREQAANSIHPKL